MGEIREQREASERARIAGGVADSGSANASAERGGRSESAGEREEKEKKHNGLDANGDDDDGAFPRRARVAYCKYKLVPTEHLRRREQ